MTICLIIFCAKVKKCNNGTCWHLAANSGDDIPLLSQYKAMAGLNSWLKISVVHNITVISKKGGNVSMHVGLDSGSSNLISDGKCFLVNDAFAKLVENDGNFLVVLKHTNKYLGTLKFEMCQQFTSLLDSPFSINNYKKRLFPG